MALKCSSRCSTRLAFAKQFRSGIPCKNNNYLFREQYITVRKGYPDAVYYAAGVVAAVLCYVNSLPGEFVHDDIFAVKNNPDVRPDSPLSRVFSDDFWGKPMSSNTSHKSYRPLCVLSFRFNYAFGGLDPVGYHVTNVGLHAVATLMFTYMCAKVVFHQVRLAGLAGLIFAVHPIHTEAVSGIVGRADVLACVLFQAAFLAYVRSVKADSSDPCVTEMRSMPLFAISMMLAAAAMLTKEHGVTVLAVCLLYDVFIVSWPSVIRWLQGKEKLCVILPLIGRSAALQAVLTVLLVFRLWMLNGQLPAFSDQDNPASFSPHLSTRFLTYCHLYAFNAWLLISPTTLSYDWQMNSIPLVENVCDPRNLATVLFFTTMIMLTKRCISSVGSERRRLFLGLLLLAFPFLPAANIFFRVGFVVAERILYISSMGSIILTVASLDRLRQKFRVRSSTLVSIMCILVAVWTCKTVTRNKVWASREALFRSGLQTLPHNAKMHYNYANLMKDTNVAVAVAVRHYREATRLWPTYASAHNNLGTQLSDLEEAESHYRKAIFINHQHANAHFNLGNLLSNRGDKIAALESLRVALTLDKDSSAVHQVMANVLADLGHVREAEGHHQRVLELSPNDAECRTTFGIFLSNTGRTQEALGVLREAYTLNPTSYIAMRNAAKILRLSGHNDKAEQLYLRALSLSRDAVTLDLAGVLYFNTQRFHTALQLFSEASRKDASKPDLLLHHAQVLSVYRRFTEAEEQLQRALRLNPGYVDVLHQLANVYGERKLHQRAIQLMKKAIEQTHDPWTLAYLYSDLARQQKDSSHLNDSFQSYKKAVELNPALAGAQHNLAIIYHTKGDYTMARHHYNEAYRLEPGNQLLLENRGKLDRVLASDR